MDELQLKHKAILSARDMNPYINLLIDTAKYFDSGFDIDILEIGVRRGASTKSLLRGLTNRVNSTGHLYSIDIVNYDRIIRDPELRKLWTFIQGDSREVIWNKEIDILLIDGNHSFEGVKADFEKYEPWVRISGLILMHDITYRRFGVKEFWKQITLPKANLNLNNVGLGIVNKV